jgi:hypothetical protein
MHKNTFDESRLGLRDDLSLSLSLQNSFVTNTPPPPPPPPPSNTTTTTTTHRKKVLSRKKKKKKKRERALRFPSCGGLFLSSSCFVLLACVVITHPIRFW